MPELQHSTASLPDDVLNEALVRLTLVKVFDVVLPTAPDVEYRLVGTASALLRGISLSVADIDILLKERSGVDLFHKALSPSPAVACLVPPTWLSDSRQYFARYKVGEVTVELSTVELDAEMESDTLECVGRGPWQYCDFVACGPYLVPTVAIELRLLTELSRNRADKYLPILEYLQTHQCNMGLVRRGLATSRISNKIQRETLKYIESRPA
jgi:hypothetical protein